MGTPLSDMFCGMDVSWKIFVTEVKEKGLFNKVWYFAFMRIKFDTNVKFNLFAYFKPKGCNLAKKLKIFISVILIHLQNYVLYK